MAHSRDFGRLLYLAVVCTSFVFSSTSPAPCPALNPEAFTTEAVVPDVIDTTPTESLCVTYENQVTLANGNELTPKQVKTEPQVSWGNVNQDKFYLLSMVDPDAPSRAMPILRSANHWLVGNIAGGDLTTGETLVEYIGSGPPNGVRMTARKLLQNCVTYPMHCAGNPLYTKHSTGHGLHFCIEYD